MLQAARCPAHSLISNTQQKQQANKLHSCGLVLVIRTKRSRASDRNLGKLPNGNAQWLELNPQGSLTWPASKTTEWLFVSPMVSCDPVVCDIFGAPT